MYCVEVLRTVVIDVFMVVVWYDLIGRLKLYNIGFISIVHKDEFFNKFGSIQYSILIMST